MNIGGTSVVFWPVIALVIGLFVFVLYLLRSRSLIRGQAEQLLVHVKDLDKSLVEANAFLKSEKEKSAEIKEWSSRTEQQLKDSFKALASEELHNNSERFQKRAGEELGGLIKPLREDLTKMDSNVRNLEKARAVSYESLNVQVMSLFKETSKLNKSLSSQIDRGHWGEHRLRQLVELSGMLEHVDFEEQMSATLKDPDRKVGRPDMIIRGPQGRIFPVDSKAPLDAYQEAMETNDDKVRRENIKRHVKAMKDRITELSRKEYWNQFSNSPDFVVMFVPIDSSLTLAQQHDPDIIQFSMQKNVILVSPMLLMALLRIIRYVWQEHTIIKNAQSIADEGKEYFKRLGILSNHLVNVAKSFDNLLNHWNQAVGSLERTLKPQAEKLRKLGASGDEIEFPERIGEIPRRPHRTEDESDSQKALPS